MNDIIISEFIRSVRLFDNLTHEETQQLLDAADETQFAKDETIFAEGEESRALYIVLEGNVRISVATPITVDTEIVTIEPRGVFGESSFFHPSPHHASAQCLTPVRLIRLGRSQYDELLQSGNVAAYKLAANAADLLGERLQQTDEWVERMLQGRQNAEVLSNWKKFRGVLRSTGRGSGGWFKP